MTTGNFFSNAVGNVNGYIFGALEEPQHFLLEMPSVFTFFFTGDGYVLVVYDNFRLQGIYRPRLLFECTKETLVIMGFLANNLLFREVQ